MDELKVAIKAAKQAEKIANEYWGELASRKADNSPVTIADTLAEDVIRKTILEEFPDHSILGEEKGKSGESEYVWIIDPIDGTLFYSRGMKYFSTLISLMKKDELVLGVSNAPKLDELMYAKKGEGAYLNGKKIKVSKVSKFEDSVVFHSSVASFSKTKKLTNLEALGLNVWRTVGYANLLGSHAIATGGVEGFVGAKLKIWDIAALAVIVEEAGGRATELGGGALTLDSTSAILTNGLIHDNLLNFFSKSL
ncbi:MAG: inositol monophosphatase [Candidatus Altiarchaeota archaeon]|nr:inositol monophosphatase [Candidatus Altiarchaeota archaeon]